VRRLPVALPAGGWVPLEEVAGVAIRSGASRIYREEGERYIAVTFSVRGPDLGSAVADAQARVRRLVPRPDGYQFEWGGEFESAERAANRLAVVIPLAVGVVFVLLFLMFRRIRDGLIVLGTVLVASPLGGLFALWITGTNLSVSSGVGFLALFGVSVQTGVILVSYMNDLRRRGADPGEAAVQAADLRLRPVLMTALVASLGLLPAALSTDIGSDSQRPLAIVVVGGLLGSLALSLFLIPAFYRRFAGPVPAPEPSGNPPAA
jgi:cobalt-zinc-cadmium resistance protein CzcA